MAETAPLVRGFLHRAASRSGDGLVLTHGAGGNSNSPLLIALAEKFAMEGIAVLRCDLPFRQRRNSGPPRNSAAEDQQGLRRAVEEMRKVASRRVFLGGQSYGGRQATMLAAEDAAVADGLLILSYPLHPPGKPEQLRTRHLASLRVPTLFVSGAEDPFGSPAELKAALKLIPAKTSLITVEAAGHGLGFGRRSRNQRSEIPERVVHEFLQFFADAAHHE